MSLDISSSSGRRTDLLLFPQHDADSTTLSPSSSYLPSASGSSRDEKDTTPFTTTTTTSAPVLSSATDSSSSVYPASSAHSTPTSALTPSSSSNSVWTAASAHTSVASSPSSQHQHKDEYEYSYEDQDQHDQQHQHQHEQDEYDQDDRRSLNGPAPLPLKTSSPSGEDKDKDDDHADDFSDAGSSRSHETLRTAPRTSSLSTFSTVSSPPSLPAAGSTTSAPAPAPAPAPVAAPPYAYNRASIAPIRRKPLSSSARTSIAAASIASASARSSIIINSVADKLNFDSGRGSREIKEPLHLPALPPLPPLPQLRANISPQISPTPEDTSFDLDSELEAEFNSLQFVHDEDELLGPNHRFTRPGDIDSPTLYDFPTPSAATFGANAPAALGVRIPSNLSREPSVASKASADEPEASDPQSPLSDSRESRNSTDSDSIKELLSPVHLDAAAEESIGPEQHEAPLDSVPDLVPTALAAPVAALSVSESAPIQNTAEQTPAPSQTAPSLNESANSAVTAVSAEGLDSPSLSSADEHEYKSESDPESDYPFVFAADDVDVVDTEDTQDIRSEYSDVADDKDIRSVYSDVDGDAVEDIESEYSAVDGDLFPSVPSATTPVTEPHQLAQAPAEEEELSLARTETKSETYTPPVSTTVLSSRQSTMSLFNRKTGPPHLSLGAISNNSNPNIANATASNSKEDNAQRAVSQHSSTNDLYTVYDEHSPAPRSPLPVISTAGASSNTSSPVVRNNSVSIDTAVPGDSPTGTLKVAKSPSSFKLGNFFGWPSPSPASTEFSDQAYSPLASPSSPSSLRPPNTVVTNASTLSTPASATSPRFPQETSNNNSKTGNSNLLGIISPKSNVSGDESSFYYDEYLATPPTTATLQVTPTGHRQAQHVPPSPTSDTEPPPPQSPTGLIEDMEDELKAISAELAGSIRREMDLDDLVDRLQAEINNAPQTQSMLNSKRTSDYFSDSGTSSNKYGDYDAAKEEIAQVQRRAEQEKAQLRLELTEKLTDERSRRRALDRQIKELSERAAEVDVAALQRDSNDASGRVKQLESTCEDLRRRLNEERTVKENFEDLLSGMKMELQNTANERDNLRDEIVPQLRARVEGLELQSAEQARQVYETTKMQQELQSLKEENLDLRSTAAAASSAAAITAANILADSEQHLRAGPGLSRSNTVNRGQPGGPPSTTVSNNQSESREALAERLKDVEAQRDALHSALKSLLERQEFQNRDNDKKIRILEAERQRLLTASPKKAGYERDVANLREEISVLRKRAEEALDQKWQTEKGLGGLKMDLDRAESEIANLRAMLLERDAEGGMDGLTSTAGLEKAFQDLQDSYASLLSKVSPSTSDEVTSAALERLERALATTVSGRDAAMKDTARSRLAAEGQPAGSEALLDSERSVAEQLELSARRVEELAQQVREQIQTNSTLRERLSQMVARGEASQHANKARITGLESRLRTLEEQLVASQTAAEERVARHEDQVAALNEARNSQLMRLRDASGTLRSGSPVGGAMASPLFSPRAMRSPGLRSPSPLKSPFGINGKLVPPMTGGNGASLSRPSSRGSMMSFNGGSGTSSAAAAAAAAAAAYAHATAADQEQQAQVTTLRARVGELEAALSTADSEMQEVVARLSMAQVEVLQLQEELDAAGRDARRLQRTLEEERTKGFEERFRLISQPAMA